MRYHDCMSIVAALLLTWSPSALTGIEEPSTGPRDATLAPEVVTSPGVPGAPGATGAPGARAVFPLERRRASEASRSRWAPPDWRDPLRLDLETLVAGEWLPVGYAAGANTDWALDWSARPSALDSISPLYEDVMRLYDDPTPWTSVVVRVDPFGSGISGPCN